jgi:hypothetical protein
MHFTVKKMDVKSELDSAKAELKRLCNIYNNRKFSDQIQLEGDFIVSVLKYSRIKNLDSRGALKHLKRIGLPATH